MKIDVAALSGVEAYKWLVQLVVPRPIGWVSTVDEEGRPNLAPFSWFQTICSTPPILLIACGYRKTPGGELIDKDTLRNAEATGQCVIQLAERAQIGQLVATAADLPPGASEFEHAGLEPVPSELVAPPRVSGARVAFECEVEEVVRREGWKTSLLFARVVLAHVDDALIADPEAGPAGFDAAAWAPIARLGGTHYAELGERFEVSRE